MRLLQGFRVYNIAIGSIVVPCCGLYLGSYNCKVVRKGTTMEPMRSHACSRKDLPFLMTCSKKPYEGTPKASKVQLPSRDSHYYRCSDPTETCKPKFQILLRFVWFVVFVGLC